MIFHKSNDYLRSILKIFNLFCCFIRTYRISCNNTREFQSVNCLSFICDNEGMPNENKIILLIINYYSKTEVKAHNEGRVIYEMLNIWSVFKFLVVF